MRNGTLGVALALALAHTACVGTSPSLGGGSNENADGGAAAPNPPGNDGGIADTGIVGDASRPPVPVNRDAAAPVGHDAGVGGDAGGHVAVDASAPQDSGGGGTVVIDASEDGSPEQLCVDIVNQYRATLSLPPYTRWTANEACVDKQAAADGDAGVAHSAFGQCGEWGQCECPGWSGSYPDVLKGCLAAMWAEGPGGGHYDIMSSTSYTQVACGFATLSSGAVWATQDYK